MVQTCHFLAKKWMEGVLKVNQAGVWRVNLGGVNLDGEICKKLELSSTESPQIWLYKKETNPHC